MFLNKNSRENSKNRSQRSNSDRGSSPGDVYSSGGIKIQKINTQYPVLLPSGSGSNLPPPSMPPPGAMPHGTGGYPMGGFPPMMMPMMYPPMMHQGGHGPPPMGFPGMMPPPMSGYPGMMQSTGPPPGMQGAKRRPNSAKPPSS